MGTAYLRPKQFSVQETLFIKLGLNGSELGLMIFHQTSPRTHNWFGDFRFLIVMTYLRSPVHVMYLNKEPCGLFYLFELTKKSGK